MIIIKRQGDNYRDIIDWLTENVSPNSKPNYEPSWGSPHSQKVEWQAQNQTWRIVLDDKTKEMAITVMDATRENVLRKILSEREQS